MCVNLVVLRKLCKKSRCFPGEFTQLAQILHDRRSWRSRQISTLHVIAHSASVLKWDYHDYPGKNVGGTKKWPNRSQFFKGSQLITSLLIFSVSGVPVSPPSPLVELGRGSNNQNGNLRWFLKLNPTYMKRILHLVSVKNITFKSSYNWFKIDIHQQLWPLTANYLAMFKVISTTIYT